MEIRSGRKAADLKVFIAMPALDGRMHCVTGGALLDSQAALILAGVPNTAYVNFMQQDSNLPFARNRTIAQFMATDCTDLVYIDSDMGWDSRSFMRLICHPVDFVGASYRQKIQGPDGNLVTKYAIDFLYDEEGNSPGSDPKTGLMPVRRLPFGFIRVTREAIQRMYNECDVPEYDIEHQGRQLHIHRLFANEWNGEQEVGEDYTFCDRWRSIGGTVWCDPELRVSHHGLATFHGHLGGYMREILAQAEKEGKVHDVAVSEGAGLKEAV
jgi:hypothetical protein